MGQRSGDGGTDGAPPEETDASLISISDAQLSAELARRQAAASTPAEDEFPSLSASSAALLMSAASAGSDPVDELLKDPSVVGLIREQTKLWMKHHRRVLSAPTRLEPFQKFLAAMGDADGPLLGFDAEDDMGADSTLVQLISRYNAADPPSKIVVKGKCILECDDAAQLMASENRLQAARVSFSLVAARETVLCIRKDVERANDHAANADTQFLSAIGALCGESPDPGVKNDFETRAASEFAKSRAQQQTQASFKVKKLANTKKRKHAQKELAATKAQSDAQAQQSSIRAMVTDVSSAAGAVAGTAAALRQLGPQSLPPGQFFPLTSANPSPWPNLPDQRPVQRARSNQPDQPPYWWPNQYKQNFHAGRGRGRGSPVSRGRGRGRGRSSFRRGSVQ